MPLIILGLLVVIGIIAYWFIGNSSSDKPLTPRDIRERYTQPVKEKAKDTAKEVKEDVAKKIRKRAGIYDADYDIEDDGYGNTIPFPSDVEREKKKRDIH